MYITKTKAPQGCCQYHLYEGRRNVGSINADHCKIFGDRIELYFEEALVAVLTVEYIDSTITEEKK